MTASPSFAPGPAEIRRLVAAVIPAEVAPDAPATDALAPDALTPDALTPDALTPDSLITDALARDALARAAWTGIAEPGDRAATLLVGGLGAWRALAALHASATPFRLLDALTDAASGGGGAGALNGRGAGDGGEGRDDRDARCARAADALDLSEREWAAALARWAPRLDPSAAERHLRQAAMVGAQLMIPSSPLWPTGVDDLGEHAPIALWWRGTPRVLEALGRSVALVGARAATGYGEHVAVEASAGLVDRGFAIVSGAAYGIDGTAHRAALAGGGTTVAILAGGVDRFYPSGHGALPAASRGRVPSCRSCPAAPPPPAGASCSATG